MSRLTIGAALAALVGLLPAAADAHPFVQPYTLPVPVWMYLYGSVATLVVSFAIIGYFVSTPGAGLTYRAIDVSVGPVGAPLGRALLALLRALSVGGLLLCIVAGFVGTRDPFRNINMTLFWILFVLGLTYVTALIGNVYALVNPWKLVIEGLDALGLDVSTPQVKYPERLGYYPALLFYFGLIWLEIFFHTTPYSLSIVLLVYSLLTLAGTLVFGKEAWFRYGEFFSVFLRLVGMLAPVEYRPDPARGRPWGARLRWPFSGTLAERADHMSLVLFVLFMLSSTTYDGIRDTILWVGLFWRDIWTLIQPFWGVDIIQAYPRLMPWYLVYQRVGLLVFPFLYLGLYLLVLLWARAATRSKLPLRTLALQFAFSLIPIAFVYHMTHYFTLLLNQWRSVPYLLSDPFGRGWNLLGLAPAMDQVPIGMGFIWHTQVALILGGHIASVYLAHVVAIRLFPSHRQAVASQIPMLLLMVAYTAIGLWVLSLPIAAGGTG